MVRSEDQAHHVRNDQSHKADKSASGNGSSGHQGSQEQEQVSRPSDIQA